MISGQPNQQTWSLESLRAEAGIWSPLGSLGRAHSLSELPDHVQLHSPALNEAAEATLRSLRGPWNGRRRGFPRVQRLTPPKNKFTINLAESQSCSLTFLTKRRDTWRSSIADVWYCKVFCLGDCKCLDEVSLSRRTLVGMKRLEQHKENTASQGPKRSIARWPAWRSSHPYKCLYSGWSLQHQVMQLSRLFSPCSSLVPSICDKEESGNLVNMHPLARHILT